MEILNSRRGFRYGSISLTELRKSLGFTSTATIAKMEQQQLTRIE
jgi:hypothetical protein